MNMQAQLLAAMEAAQQHATTSTEIDQGNQHIACYPYHHPRAWTV